MTDNRYRFIVAAMSDLNFVVRSLQAAGREQWPVVAQATKISVHTIIKIAREYTRNPRANTLEPLRDYFRRKSRRPQS